MCKSNSAHINELGAIFQNPHYLTDNQNFDYLCNKKIGLLES